MFATGRQEEVAAGMINLYVAGHQYTCTECLLDKFPDKPTCGQSSNGLLNSQTERFTD